MGEYEEEMQTVHVGFFEKIRGLMMRPMETFQKMREDTLGEALRYWIVLVVIFSLLYAAVYPFYIATMFSSFEGMEGGPDLEDIPIWGTLFAGEVSIIMVLIIFILLVVFSFIGLFISGAWLHLWVRLMGGKRRYAQTVKAVAYAQTPSLLFGWIPFVGFIFGIWSLVLEVFGIREMHEIPTEKAAIAVIAAIVSIIIIAVIIALAVIFLVIGLSSFPSVD
ncbi:MAG: hypothetical protein DRN21_03125 [Thermoplasmata archaeon]|nr:MAG: hypothetical protein DRN21_03125 [Thermoplasmata archaeon]